MEVVDQRVAGCSAALGAAREDREVRDRARRVLAAGEVKGDDRTTCGSYTKADFVARADAICASTLRELRSLPTASAPSRVLTPGLGGYLAQALPILRREARALDALRRPGGSAHERVELRRYLDVLSANLISYQRLAGAAVAGDAHAVSAAERALAASDIDGLAARYGILSCGAPGATIG